MSLQQLLSVILLYPILEELAFRGWLQETLLTKGFQKQKFGFSQANLFTSILFVSLHFFNHSLLWATAVFFPSLVFGFFRDRHNSVLPSILLHIYYNAGYFLLF
jgi:uncharacterized protein